MKERRWLIHCSEPTAGPPALMIMPESCDDIDAVVAYHDHGYTGLLAITAWLHVAREIEPWRLALYGVRTAFTLDCPHTLLRMPHREGMR
ncbi:MAG: hypothetical protein HOQ05_12935 [Corynebacteriales bacterium]|nr:hypothetical protein [Mycobacteriales bacterium]